MVLFNGVGIIKVLAANAVPVLIETTTILIGTDENTTSPEQLVSSFVGNITDGDIGAL